MLSKPSLTKCKKDNRFLCFMSGSPLTRNPSTEDETYLRNLQHYALISSEILKTSNFCVVFVYLARNSSLAAILFLCLSLITHFLFIIIFQTARENFRCQKLKKT